MKIIDLDQGSDEWKAWRRSGITASEVAVLFGTSPFKTRWQLWAEKLGRRIEDDIEANPYVRRGKRCEHALREHVVADRNLGIMPICCENDQDPFIRASLDGIDARSRPWEFKVPSPRKFEEIRDGGADSVAYRTYWPQVQAQMLCTGATEGFLVFGSVEETRGYPRVIEYLTFLVPADPAYHDLIRREADRFRTELDQDIEPARDPDRDLFAPTTADDAARWCEAADALLPLLMRKEELEAELKSLKTLIEAAAAPVVDVLAENKTGEFSGLRATRVTREGAVDWKALLKSLGHDPSDETFVGGFRKSASEHHQFRRIG